MIELNLAALHVIIPLCAAPFCALSNKGYIAWGVALVATWLSFAITISLLLISISNSLSYPMGNWIPPLGIEYRIDILSAFVLVLIAGIASVMMPYAAGSVAKEIPANKQPLFFCVFLLCLSGLLGIVSTNDVFNIYVFLEISSLATYTLIAMGKDRRAITAAFEYLILGTIGATFILIGIGLLYMMTGTLNITDLAKHLSNVKDYRPIEAAFAFLTLGLALKIAMFPLHLWLTNAYAYAPSFISAFLSATATKVSLYVLIRFMFSLFGVAFVYQTMPTSLILGFLGVAGILIGSLVAIYQPNIKRMLAFSSVAQIGYVVLGLALASTTGLTASLVHIFNHALAKGALFLAVGCVFWRIGGTRIEDFKGLGKTMPWTMAAFVLAGLSLIGIPGTAGFVSKWYFVQALIEAELWPLVFVILLSSLFAAMYIWRVIQAAYFDTAIKRVRTKTLPNIMLIPTWALSLLGVYFGFKTEYSLIIAKQASSYLFGGGY